MPVSEACRRDCPLQAPHTPAEAIMTREPLLNRGKRGKAILVQFALRKTRPLVSEAR